MEVLDAGPRVIPGPRDGWPRAAGGRLGAGRGAVSQPQWQMPPLKEANGVYLEAT